MAGCGCLAARGGTVVVLKLLNNHVPANHEGTYRYLRVLVRKHGTHSRTYGTTYRYSVLVRSKLTRCRRLCPISLMTFNKHHTVRTVYRKGDDLTTTDTAMVACFMPMHSSSKINAKFFHMASSM